MYGKLPKNEAIVNIDTVGMDTGIKYEGAFTIRCTLTISQRHQLEIEKTRLMAGFGEPSAGLATLAGTLATLWAHIVSGPSWWEDTKRGTEILDENVLYDLLKKVYEATDAWREALKPKTEIEPGN